MIMSDDLYRRALAKATDRQDQDADVEGPVNDSSDHGGDLVPGATQQW
jgi:hypothetical protein